METESLAHDALRHLYQSEQLVALLTEAELSAEAIALQVLTERIQARINGLTLGRSHTAILARPVR